MRIIAKRTLREFWRRTPQAQEPLRAWYATRERRRHAGASVLPGNRVVFNIGGNRYRLVVRVNYAYRVVYIRFVATHADHDRIDAETV